VTYYRYTVFLIIMIVLASASWWTLTIIDPERHQGITISQEGPDHFMEDFISTTLGETGTPLHRLIASRLTHFPNQQHSDLLEPVMTFYRTDNSIWVASAKEGRILDDGNEIFLQGDVNIKRPGEPTSMVTIHTRDLHILPNDDIAETPNSVVVQQDQQTVTATGMYAHFGQGEVDLLSDVRGWYVD
jgi:lipopolysaccharide export system protein LptC